MLKFTAGQQIKEFSICRARAYIDADGRPRRADSASGTLRAAVAGIDPATEERARQLGHTATHKLIARGRADVREGDILRRGDESYYVWAVRDPALMGMYTVLLCERRRA